MLRSLYSSAALIQSTGVPGVIPVVSAGSLSKGIKKNPGEGVLFK
jgi:hypothetical protein